MRLYASIWQYGAKDKYEHPQDISYPGDIYESGRRFLETVDVTGTARFTTQLHGGFGDCSFVVRGPRDKTAMRYRMYINAHVVVFDIYGKRVYEGFVSGTTLSEEGLAVTCTGYYAKAGNYRADPDLLSAWLHPLPAANNLVANPSFEVNVTTNWTHFVPQGSVTRVVLGSGNVPGGTAAAKFTIGTNPDSWTTIGTYIVLSPNTKYTLSVYAKNTNCQVTPEIVIDQIKGDMTAHESEIEQMSGMPTTYWLRYIRLIETKSDVVGANIWIRCPGQPGGGEFYIDAVQVEVGEVPTAYLDGSLVHSIAGDIYRWSGAAHASTSSRSAWVPTVAAAVKKCVEFVPEWNQFTAFIAGYTNITENDYSDKRVRDIIELMMRYGYTNDEADPIYFAIWNHRTPYVAVDTGGGSYPEWMVPFRNITRVTTGRGSISLSADNVYNKVQAVYGDQGYGQSLTTPVEDLISQDRYGKRDGIVQNGGSIETIALANTLRNAALKRYRYPQQSCTVEVSGLVTHSTGFVDYPYRVRAGQLIMISDLDVSAVHQGSMWDMVESGISGFILRTEYNSDGNTIRLELGLADQSFEVAMGRLGLSGGLS